MIDNQIAENSISVSLVPDQDRFAFFQKHFGPYLVEGEALVFTWMRRLAPEYNGGYWNFFELSNGGFYLALKNDKKKRFKMFSGYIESEVSADAAGVVATLYAINYLLNTEHEKNLRPDQEKAIEDLDDGYYKLRDFASEHPEATEIFALID